VLKTTTWPELELSVVSEIQLDPKNVRLETTDTQVEADILEDLFANEDVLKLVDGISKIGYLTHETPIVVKRRGKYIVVEGNRRVAALKAIQNPLIVPRYQARVIALTQDIPDISSLEKIRVMVAPNQSIANQIIAAIHTGNLRKPWNPVRRAAFFQIQISNGQKYADLVSRYPTINVKHFVFRGHIINLFQNMKYDDPTLNDFIKTQEWREGLSTLSRIYESATFLELTGFTMDDKGVFSKAISDEAMMAVATIIVEGIKTEDLNTRSLNTVGSPRFKMLMTELKEAISSATADENTSESDAKPTTGSAGNSSSNPTGGSRSSASSNQGGEGEGNSSSTGQPGPAKAKPAAKKAKTRFLPLGNIVSPPVYPTAVSLHLQELSALDIQKFPNTTFLALRALLEKSIKSYAEIKGIDIRASGNNSHGYVQLHHALRWFSQYVSQNGPRALVQPTNQLQNGKLINYTASADALNAINHNNHFNVDPDEVINCWNSIDSIMRELMKP
jgi:hypothetical protein